MKAKEQYSYWLSINEKSVIEKIAKLVLDIQNNPFSGLGKPEPLKGNYTGYWSRSITQ